MTRRRLWMAMGRRTDGRTDAADGRVGYLLLGVGGARSARARLRARTVMTVARAGPPRLLYHNFMRGELAFYFHRNVNRAKVAVAFRPIGNGMPNA